MSDHDVGVLKATPAPAAAPARKPTPLRLHEATAALDYIDELIVEHADRIAALGGDIEAVPEIAALLAFAESDFEAAMERVALKSLALKGEEEMIQMEADRLTAAVKRRKNARERLNEYAKRMLEVRGKVKVATPLATVRIQKNSQPSVSAMSESVIEELYVNGSPLVVQKVSYALDRDAVLAAWKADAQLPADLPDLEEQKQLPAGIVVLQGTHLRVS